MSGTVAVRLDFARAVLDDVGAARAIGAVLTRPCCVALERVSGRHKDRWSRHAAVTGDLITEYLTAPAFDAVHLDTRRGTDLAASAAIENGLHGRVPGEASTGMHGYLVVPFIGADVEQLVGAACELATILDAGAGYIGLEPRYGLAKRLALSSLRPKARPGLSEDRQRRRRARHWKSELIAAQVASVEWGTFLGASHLERLDLAHVRASGAFARVVELSSKLVFLQVTADPGDDLSGELEAKLPAAREALAPLMMDISDVNLE